MRFLPLDHPEPFAATLGVMLYPGLDGDDPAKARAFAAQWLATPLQRFHADEHRLPYAALRRIAEDAGQQLTDVDKRWDGGLAVGNLFKAFFVLAKDHPTLASWEHTIVIYERCARCARMSASRSGLWKEISRFRSVAHFWGAWSIRDGKFGGQPEREYDGYDDFQCFLTEAEILRDFGQKWRLPRQKSEPPLPADVWCVRPEWRPPVRLPNWPNTGMIPDLALAADLIAGLKPPGRPRRVG